MLVPTGVNRVLFDEAGVSEILQRLASQMLDRVSEPSQLLLVGIMPQGLILAQRLARIVEEAAGKRPLVGCLALDASPTGEAVLSKIDLPAAVEGRTVVVVDDVVQSGCTAATAFSLLDALGSPTGMHLAVLADRDAHQRLVGSDYVGEAVLISDDEEPVLFLKELDGFDEMIIRKRI